MSENFGFDKIYPLMSFMISFLKGRCQNFERAILCGCNGDGRVRNMVAVKFILYTTQNTDYFGWCYFVSENKANLSLWSQKEKRGGGFPVAPYLHPA